MKLIKEITYKDIIGTEGLSQTQPRLTARAFLFNKYGHVAVMYSKKFSLHSIPGGGIEDEENKIDAVKRELLEETGCECNIIDELGYVYENRAHCDYTTISYYYIAKVKYDYGKTYLTQDEMNNGTCVEWHSIDDAIRLIKTPCHETLQRKFIQRRDISALEALIERLPSLNICFTE